MIACCPNCGLDLETVRGVVVGDLEMSLSGDVRFKGAEVRLTSSEAMVLWTLAKAVGTWVKIDALLNVLDSNATGNVINVFVARIRRKLCSVDPGFDLIETKWGGGGYRWRA